MMSAILGLMNAIMLFEARSFHTLTYRGFVLAILRRVVFRQISHRDLAQRYCKTDSKALRSLLGLFEIYEMLYVYIPDIHSF